MTSSRLDVPVAFLVFNRPDTTERVFAEIARAKPAKLLVVADGPRSNRPGEAEKCAETRAIIESVDWNCEVLTNYSDVNLGCKRRVSSGLDWVFENVEEAIILEDDCVPHPTFFRYCEELLDRYRDDRRIMAISGDNFQFGRRRSPYSYYFSRYNHEWGWATWRRAWQHYDVTMSVWPEIRDGAWLQDILGKTMQGAYWHRAFDTVYEGKIDTWDYQWTFACWLQNGLTILPNVNLVSNIGYGEAATHTRSTESPLANMRIEAIQFPLMHPPYVIRDTVADERTARVHYSTPSYWKEVVKYFLWLMQQRTVSASLESNIKR